MNIIQKISFVRKFSKAYKSIKNLLDNYSGKTETVKEGLELIKQGVDKILPLCPDTKEFYLAVKEIISNTL